jgi:drug/metabolite transporter (DMT)-like permease
VSDTALPQPERTGRRAGTMQRGTTYTLMVTHVILASGTYVFGKEAAVGFADPGALTLARALGAAVCLLLLTGWAIPRPHFSAGEWLRVLALGIILVPVNQYTFLRGLKHTVPSHPALLYALTPLGVLLLASALNRALPSRRKVGGLLIALLGVVIVLRPWEQGQAIAEIREGDIWVLIGVAAWVVYTVAAGRTCEDHDPRVVTAWSLILGAVAMAPIAGPSLLTMDYGAVHVRAWLGLAYLVVMTSVVMLLAWNLLLRHLGPVEVAICTNAQPPATAGLSAFLAGLGMLSSHQDLTSLFWLGTALVIIGVVLVQAREMLTAHRIMRHR